MAYALGLRSKMRLRGVHADLVKVVERAIAISEIDFTVLEGVRTIARQKELMASGATRTMNSRHITGHAVDLGAMVNGQIRWDWPLYSKIHAAMDRASKELAIPVEWGGLWTTFKDGPHYQLPWKEYPR